MEIEKFQVKVAASLIFVVAGFLLTMARRWKNADDNTAGMGIAGWTVFALLCIWI